MKKQLQDGLGGGWHTMLLVQAQHFSWLEHKTKAETEGHILPISIIIAQCSALVTKRVCFHGHWYQVKQQAIVNAIYKNIVYRFH